MKSRQVNQSKRLTALTYNLFAQAAQPELEQLHSVHNFDIVCLQECHPKIMPRNIGDLHLAANTTQGRYGLAIYYNDARFDLLHSETAAIRLPQLERFHESLRKSTRQRLLIAQFRERHSGREAVVGCFHATQLPSANSVRRRQISQAIEALDSVSTTATALLIGDYNYPVFIGGLRQFVQKFNYELVIPDKPTYRAKLFKGYQLDLAAVHNAEQARAETLPQGISDHLPVKVTLNIAM